MLCCFAVVLLLSSCETDNSDEQSQPFAIEAWIDNDGYPVVILTRSIRPSSKPVDVTEAMVRWAKVTISDGESTVVMTGGVDHQVFPPFSYKSFAICGKIGRTYTITAEYDGVSATATSTILQPAEITAIDFNEIGDDLYSATLSYAAPEGSDACYLVAYTMVKGVDDRYYPSYLGTVKVSGTQRTGTMPLCRGKHVDLAESFTPYFCKGDTVDVILARVDPIVYDFWNAFQDEVYFGNNIFISANNTLVGNIIGGYGVFSARGVTHSRCVVE